jgi:hypothetical protein
MAGKAVTHEAAVLNVMRAVSLTAFTPYIGFFTTNPTNDNNAGTEMTGGNYARQSCTFGAPTGYGPSSMTNTGAVTWSGVTWSGTIVGWGIWDLSSAGNLRYWVSMTSKVVNSGDTVQFAISALTVTED